MKTVANDWQLLTVNHGTTHSNVPFPELIYIIYMLNACEIIILVYHEKTKLVKKVILVLSIGDCILEAVHKPCCKC